MNRPILAKKQIYDLVFENKYKITAENRFFSRCIDGRYPNEDSHSLAIAGADAGQLAILYATANIYAFEIDKQKTLQTLLEVIGGPQNFNFHSNTKEKKTVPGEGCAHMSEMNADPAAYSLDKEQIILITDQLAELLKAGAQEQVLEGNNNEGAILQITGDWAVYPQYHLSTARGTVPVQVFIYHKTLVNERNRAIAKKLIENKAVTLFDDLDEEYLYEVISSVTEDHFFETAKRIAKQLPLYDLIFQEDGTFTVEDRGVI